VSFYPGSFAAMTSADLISGGSAKELRGLRHQRLGDPASQVRLSARLVREGVEDGELRRP